MAAGFIRDTGNKIKQLVADTAFDLNIRKDYVRSDHFWVAGRVEDEKGVPLENVGVYVDNDSLPVTNSDKHGSFTLHLPVNGTGVGFRLVKKGYETYSMSTLIYDELYLSADLKKRRSS